MALFPVSPVDGEYANVGNIRYQYSAGLTAWNRVGTSVTPLIDGTTVNITGNLLSTGVGTQSFDGTINTTKNVFAGLSISATGNVRGGNLVAVGAVVAGGSITGASVTVNSVTTSTITASGAITGASISLAGDISSPVTATVTTGNVVVQNQVQAGSLLSLGNLTVAGNVTTGGAIVAPGNVSGGNLVTLGDITAVGNISGTYFVGNGALLSGINTGVTLGSRANVSCTTPSLANAASFNGIFNAYKGYAIYKIATSAAAWVRIYTSGNARTADASRDQYTDPQPGSGVIAEAITNGANVVVISPGTVGYNDDNPAGPQIPITVTNLSGTTQTITVTMTILQLEV